MTPIYLIPIANGRLDPTLEALEDLGAALAGIFRMPCQIRPEILDPAFAFDAARRQYCSTAILQRLDGAADPRARILGVTACDLYVPVLTFVFGEGQLEGQCAVVSTARLSEEFYGLPRHDRLLRDRLLKESAHELGHTFGLRHCADWQCVMSSSHEVSRLDLKSAEFCPRCRLSLC